jgi:hypothetical protein
MMILVLKYAKKISLPLGMKGVFFIEITLCKVKKKHETMQEASFEAAKIMLCRNQELPENIFK